jgi:uncharacterized protein
MTNHKYSSAIYSGRVWHQRFKPIKHRFFYRIFMILLDLDELETIFDPFWFWSSKKKNIACFCRNDHLGDPSIPLKQSVCNLVKERIAYDIKGPIRLLTHLRYWGYCFNPVSFYYCYDPSGQNVEVIVAEINNTPWGEQYCYVFKVNADNQHFNFTKQFHISPLMPMDMSYEWQLTRPQEKLTLSMKNFKNQEHWFSANLLLKRQAINHKNLTKVLITHPFMTLKVILAIYWQALLTWLKGANFYSHP